MEVRVLGARVVTLRQRGITLLAGLSRWVISMAAVGPQCCAARSCGMHLVAQLGGLAHARCIRG